MAEKKTKEAIQTNYGYCMHPYDIPTKRYCQTLDLKDNPELIAEYRKRHSKEEPSWNMAACCDAVFSRS